MSGNPSPSSESLKKIGKGTTIALAGSLIGILFPFLNRIIIARYGTEGQYGIFSLALVILNIFVMIATLGLRDGTSRYIAYFRAKREHAKIQLTISNSIQFGVSSSIILCLVLLFASDEIATKIFHNSGLILPLKIFSLGIPFVTLISIFIAIFRGFDRIQETVYFQNILRNVLFLILLLPIVFLGLSFTYIFYASLVSFTLCSVALIFYTVKKLSSELTYYKVGIDSFGKELLLFSLPLLGVTVLQMIISWTDTLMLGYFKNSNIVGLYNAAYPLAQLIWIPMGAMLLIYLPIATGLYGKNLIQEMRRNYIVLTRWVFAVTFPLFLILFLFPETVLNFLFGPVYVPASQALQILSVGFIIANLLGPNGTTLIVMGKTRFLMWASITASGTNVILNIALIPQWGTTGASIATTISLVLHCIIRYLKVHSLLEANPLTNNLLKPAVISIGLISLISFLGRSLSHITFWMLAVLFILFNAIYLTVVLLTKSFDNEDIMMLVAIRNRISIDVTPIKKKILKMFL